MSHEDDRPRISESTKLRMKAKGLEFEVPPNPLTVIMEDDIQHTAAFPVCDDPACCCYHYWREELTPKKPKRRRHTTHAVSYEGPPAPGGQGFSLLR